MILGVLRGAVGGVAVPGGPDLAACRPVDDGCCIVFELITNYHPDHTWQAGPAPEAG